MVDIHGQQGCKTEKDDHEEKSKVNKQTLFSQPQYEDIFLGVGGAFY